MSRWPRKLAYFWQEAPLFRPFLFLVTGIICCDQDWIGPQFSVAVMVLLLLSGAAVTGIALVWQYTRFTAITFSLCFCLFFAALGWNIYNASDAGSARRRANIEADTNGLTLVRINGAPQNHAAITKLPVECLATVHKGDVKPAKGNAWVYIYNYAGGDLSQNDSLLIPSRWQLITNRGNPFELNNAALQRRRGIMLQQFLPAADVQALHTTQDQKPFLTKAHNWCSRVLQAHIKDSTTYGLMQAMLLGDESGFDPELRQAYSQTGVIHIVSISGSHVAVLYLVVTGVLFWIKGRKGVWTKSIAGLILVWFYVLIAGGPPSAMRSALMFTFLALSTLSGREGSNLNTLTAAAFGLLLYQPAWLFSVGFQLSFGAVLSMLIFYQPIYRLWYWPKKWKLTKWAWQAASASFAAEVLTAPIVIYYFHNFPLFFLPANLLAAMLVGFCALVGGMATIAFFWLPPIAEMLGRIVTLLVHLFNAAIVRLQEWNINALQHLQINAAELVLLYLTIIAAGIWRLRKQKAGLLLALSGACALLMLLCYDRYEALTQRRLIVYNNGKVAAAEIILGRSFHLLCGSADNYNVKAAHTGYGASQPLNEESPLPYFRIGDKTTLVLTDSLQQSYVVHLPVDVLILARPLRQLHIGSLLAVFAPKEVVLAVRPSAYHLKRWQDSCMAYYVRLYNIAEQGAYILQ